MSWFDKLLKIIDSPLGKAAFTVAGKAIDMAIEAKDASKERKEAIAARLEASLLALDADAADTHAIYDEETAKTVAELRGGSVSFATPDPTAAASHDTAEDTTAPAATGTTAARDTQDGGGQEA